MKQINRFCLVLLLNLPKPDLLIILIWLVFLLLLLIFKIYIPVHFYFVSFNCLQFVLLPLFFPPCFEDHWFVFIVNLKDRKYVILDSLHKQNDDFQVFIRERLVSILVFPIIFLSPSHIIYEFSHLSCNGNFFLQYFFYTEIIFSASLGEVHAGGHGFQ